MEDLNRIIHLPLSLLRFFILRHRYARLAYIDSVPKITQNYLYFKDLNVVRGDYIQIRKTILKTFRD